MSRINNDKDRRRALCELYNMSNKVDTAIWELLDFIHAIGCQGGFKDNILNHNLRNDYIPILRNVSDHTASMIEEFDLSPTRLANLGVQKNDCDCEDEDDDEDDEEEPESTQNKDAYKNAWYGG